MDAGGGGNGGRSNHTCDVNAVLRDIDHMLYKLAYAICRATVGLSHLDDVIQKTRINLWEKAIPRFDAIRHPGVKLSTFLYHCAQNFINSEVRAIRRSAAPSRRTFQYDHQVLARTVYAKNLESDNSVEQASELIMQKPERVFTHAQCRVFRVMMANPRMPRKDMAVLLGYRRASSFSMMIRRIFNRLQALDLESLLRQA